MGLCSSGVFPVGTYTRPHSREDGFRSLVLPSHAVKLHGALTAQWVLRGILGSGPTTRVPEHLEPALGRDWGAGGGDTIRAGGTGCPPGVSARRRPYGLQGAVTLELSSEDVSWVKKRGARLPGGRTRTTRGRGGARDDRWPPGSCLQRRYLQGGAKTTQARHQGPWMLGEAIPFSFLYLPHDLF